MDKAALASHIGNENYDEGCPGVLPGRGHARTWPRGSTAGGGSRCTLDEASGPSAGRVRETQMMQEEAAGRGDLIGPLDWLKIALFEPAAASDRRGWVGLEAAHCRGRHPEPVFERSAPAITHGVGARIPG